MSASAPASSARPGLLYGHLMAVGHYGDDSDLVQGPGFEGDFDQGLCVSVRELVELRSRARSS